VVEGVLVGELGERLAAAPDASPTKRSSQNAGTPDISTFARRRRRTLSTLRSSNHDATSRSVAVLTTDGPISRRST